MWIDDNENIDYDIEELEKCNKAEKDKTKEPAQGE